MPGSNVELATARLLPELFGEETTASDAPSSNRASGDPEIAVVESAMDVESTLADDPANNDSNRSAILLGLGAAAIVFGAVLAFPTKPDEQKAPSLEDFIQVETPKKTWFQSMTGSDETIEEYKQRRSYERATRIGHMQNRQAKMSRQFSEASRGFRFQNGRLRRNTNAISR